MSPAEEYRWPASGVRPWVSQLIAPLGTGLPRFATSLWLSQRRSPLLRQKAQLALTRSGVRLASFTSMVFSAPLDGDWADRHDCKHTVLWMNSASSGMSVLMGSWMGTQLLLVLWAAHGCLSETAGSRAVDTVDRSGQHTRYRLASAAGIAGLDVASGLFRRLGVWGGLRRFDPHVLLPFRPDCCHLQPGGQRRTSHANSRTQPGHHLAIIMEADAHG